MKIPIQKCAIYTRKSTEEGLDQEFNSLDAQREACASYISSQKGSGWRQIESRYDDGGFSGGNMERPALKKLMEDIKAGLINIIVVYKIDRLTRSLMDFSKLVEVFDEYGVTFVSVTQSFNTTTSMGRLTLNVLLSFAQFEREVIGERVRDKIAASKQKGMWMGGAAPIGYKCEDRKLVPDEKSIDMVRLIFQKYLELGSVSLLKAELDHCDLKSPIRISKKGNESGGFKFSRGILYKILNNPVYVGKISHKDKVFEGQHEPIICYKIWDLVQSKLKEQLSSFTKSRNCNQRNPLKGKLIDLEGNLYSPSYTVKNNKQYRYYVSQAVLQYEKQPSGIITRLPAQELEGLIISSVEEKLRSAEITNQMGFSETDWEYHQIHKNIASISVRDLLASVLNRVTVKSGSLEIEISLTALAKYINNQFGFDLCPKEDTYMIDIPFLTGRAKSWALVIQPKLNDENKKRGKLDLPLEELNKLLQGIVWRDDHFRGMPIEHIAKREQVSATHIYKYIGLSLEF